MATGLENLRIYQMAKSLELRVFDLTKKFPRDEIYRSVDQLRRSSSSVTNNIAEAYNKQSPKDKIHIINDISKAEANETRANLELTFEKNLHADIKIISDYTELIKAISGFVRFLRNSSLDPKPKISQLTNLQTYKLNRVLAVDPGFDRVGVAVLRGGRSKQDLLFSDCLLTKRIKEHDKKLGFIGSEIKSIIKKWKPSALAVEKLYFNQNITSGIRVAEARGVVIYEGAQAGLAVYEYGPQAIKIAVAGYGKADKKQIKTMITRLIVLPAGATRVDDEIDAIALGITHLASTKQF